MCNEKMNQWANEAEINARRAKAKGIEAKQQATLFDIADDLTWKTRVNYTLKHFLERMKYYTGEKFPYKVHNIEIKV